MTVMVSFECLSLEYNTELEPRPLSDYHSATSSLASSALKGYCYDIYEWLEILVFSIKL